MCGPAAGMMLPQLASQLLLRQIFGINQPLSEENIRVLDIICEQHLKAECLCGITEAALINTVGLT